MTVDWWTLGLQAVNVLVLVWLLQHFFWRPVAAVIARRQAATEALLNAAEEQRTDVEAARTEIEKTREGFAVEREMIVADAIEEAKKTKAALMKAARVEIEKMRAAAAAEIAHDKLTAAKDRTNQQVALAVSISSRLAARLKGTAVETAFLDWLLAGIDDMPAESKREFANKGAALDLVSAEVLAAADKTRIAKAVTTALGAKPTINFRVDPTLIAGFELSSPHFTLHNSWKADLERITRELSDD